MEDLLDLIPDEGFDVPALMELQEQNQLVQSAYVQLTHEQQDVLALRFGQGYSLAETATYMKKNVNAVKALQFRAWASLHHQLGGVIHELLI